MDDGALIETYGNTDLPEGTPDRPLVTFAVFAYNQEKYIREAVEGAFSQTYSPLEIILSDDCSSDRTFEIMRAMARSYKGPHIIKAHRQIQNIGTLAHVIRVGKLCCGSILVVAAGDDISTPHRVSILVPHYKQCDIFAVCSDVTAFSRETRLDQLPEEPDAENMGLVDRRIYDSILSTAEFTNIMGASASYRSNFLSSLPNPSEKILIEDYTLGLIVHVVGMRVVRLGARLVRYRFHSENTSVRINLTFENILEVESRLSRKRLEAAKSLKYFKDYLNKYLGGACSKLSIGGIKYLDRTIQHLTLSSRWGNLSIAERLQFLWLGFILSKLTMSISRVFGIRAFVLLKYFVLILSKMKTRRNG